MSAKTTDVNKYSCKQSKEHATQIRRRAVDAAQGEIPCARAGYKHLSRSEIGFCTKVDGGVIQPPGRSEARNQNAGCHVDFVHIHPLTNVKHPRHDLQRVPSALGAQRLRR